jgi:hypothetical protein
LNRERRAGRIKHLTRDKDQIFVEEVESQGAQTCVVEIAVDEQRAPQILKLGECKVGGASRISALFAEYTQANMGLLDHAHIVRSVAYRARYRLLAARLDQLDHLGFLRWTHAAAEHSLTFHANVSERLLQLEFEDKAERLPVDYKCIGISLGIVSHASKIKTRYTWFLVKQPRPRF